MILIPVFSYAEFTSKIKGDIDDFINELEYIRKEAKRISGYNSDNEYHRFTDCYGTEFRFMIAKTSLMIWNYTGEISICKSFLPLPVNELEKRKYLEEIFRLCNEWSKGNVECSDCKNLISYKENIPHRFYAGIYCNDCWERKWKDVARKENYE